MFYYAVEFYYLLLIFFLDIFLKVLGKMKSENSSEEELF